MPPPMNSQSRFCLSVALSSRGNHIKGTDTVRPSSNTIVSSSLEQETSTARASPLVTEVGIPFLQEQILSSIGTGSVYICPFPLQYSVLRGQLRVGLASGPEGHQNVATPVRAWIAISGMESHGVAKESPDDSFATPCLN